MDSSSQWVHKLTEESFRMALEQVQLLTAERDQYMADCAELARVNGELREDNKQLHAQLYHLQQQLRSFEDAV